MPFIKKNASRAMWSWMLIIQNVECKMSIVAKYGKNVAENKENVANDG
jgi:hypothetical protein